MKWPRGELRELSAVRGSLSSQAVQKMHQLCFFFFFWLISVSGICRETQRNQGKRASSRDHMSPLCVSPSFPFPVLALGLGLFFCRFPPRGFFPPPERGRSARGLVSAPAAAAPEPRPVASVERRVEAEARRHQRQAEQS